MTAAYDGQLRIFDASKNLVHTVTAHNAPVTSVCIVPSLSSQATATPDTYLLATASHDATARLTSVSFASTASDSAHAHRTLASLHLHTAPLSSVSASPAGTHLLTASWDALLGVWDTAIPSADEVSLPAGAEEPPAKKRRRAARGGAEGESERPRRKAPLAVLKSHTGRVTKAVFGRDGRGAFSCGLDATVRAWDVEAGVCVHTAVRTSSTRRHSACL